MRNMIKDEVEKQIAVQHYGFIKEYLFRFKEKQSNLDNVIGKQKDEGSIEDTVIALYAEFGEMLNEWNKFKFWHTNRDTNIKEWKEESIDILHITMSLINMLEDITSEKMDVDDLFSITITAIYAADYADTEKSYRSLIELITMSDVSTDLPLWLTLAIFPFKDNWEEMEDMFNEKNKINLERANNKDY